MCSFAATSTFYCYSIFLLLSLSFCVLFVVGWCYIFPLSMCALQFFFLFSFSPAINFTHIFRLVCWFSSVVIRFTLWARFGRARANITELFVYFFFGMMVKYGGENNFSVFFSLVIFIFVFAYSFQFFFLSMFIFAIFSFSLVVAGAPLLMLLFAFQHIILYYFRFVHKIYGRHNLRILNSFPHFDCLVLRLWFCLLIYIFFFG